jgi:hypothetical protein
MTPADEATFIRLWQEGASYTVIARALRIPGGTVGSRATRLAKQGKIQPRPRGGTYPKQHALARTPRPVQRPVQTIDTGAVQTLSADVDLLKSEVAGLRHLVQSLVDRLDHPPVQTPVQITALPPYPKGKAVRWNLWILDVIRDDLAVLATERGISPSQLVQELLWKALTDRPASTP